MYSSRRLPVYILHDGSTEAVSGLSHLLYALRCDPQALEMVWLSFISLAGEAKLAVPLSEIEVIDNVGAAEAESSAPDLEGGLSIFANDFLVNVRKTTSTTKGDWRPVSVLFLGADPSGGFVVGLDVIKDIRGRRMAFVGKTVSKLSRARLNDAGFNLIDVVDGLVEPVPDGGTGRPWHEVLCRAIFE